MEISVGRLNNRMALQVPSELPLGLVFITGRVEQLSALAEASAPAETKRRQISFDLVDEQHRLQCRVPRQVVEETQVESGDRIRVSGHLLFDSRSVHYYLSARDLEVVAPVEPEPVPVTAVSPAVQDEREPALVQYELPEWVKHLAPPEVQEELGLEGEVGETGAEEAEPVGAEQTLAEALPEEMLDFLSGAIDSDEEIELTREMIQEYLPESARTEPAEAAPGLGRQAHAADSAAGSTEDGGAEKLIPVPQRTNGEAQEGTGAHTVSRWMLLILILIILSLVLLLALILWNPLAVGAGGTLGGFTLGGLQLSGV